MNHVQLALDPPISDLSNVVVLVLLEAETPEQVQFGQLLAQPLSVSHFELLDFVASFPRPEHAVN